MIDSLTELGSKLSKANNKLSQDNSNLIETNKKLVIANAKLVKTNKALVGKIKNQVSKVVPKVEQTKKLKAGSFALDQYYAEDGKIYFCVNLGNSPRRYLPHLAIIKEHKFATVSKNEDGGWNWFIDSLSPKMTGDYGVITDGTFYVSKTLIDEFIKKSDNDLVEIKTTATSWQTKEMSVSADSNYYIYKP
jgi:hypothetical protein